MQHSGVITLSLNLPKRMQEEAYWVVVALPAADSSENAKCDNITEGCAAN